MAALAPPLLKLGPETDYLPPINDDEIKYMREIGALSSLVDFILNAFTDEVFTENKDKAFKEKEKVKEKRVKQLTQIQESIPDTSHPNLEDMLATCKPLRNLYTVAEFLRSYIDFHHDFKYMAYKLIHPIRTRFEQQILPSMKDQPIHTKKGNITLFNWYHSWIRRLENKSKGIYCAESDDGIWNVSEVRCRELLNNLIDELLEFAQNPENVTPEGVIHWIPLTRAKAELAPAFTVRSALGADDKYDVAEIAALRALLNSKGVTQCFAESLGSGFYDNFLTSGLSKGSKPALHQSSVMQNVIMPVADWDAGSGFTKRQNVTLPSADMTPLPIFGGVANVAANDHMLRCTFSPTETMQITGVQELGLNSILKKCELALLRGNMDEEKVVDLENIECIPPHTLPFLPILKTWTDFVQIRTLSSMHRIGRPKIAMCTLDICCEYSARMYGLPYVMLSSRNTVSVACYDLHAIESFKQEQRMAKLYTLASVVEREDLKDFVMLWYKHKANLLHEIKAYTIDPALYFAINQFENSLMVYKEDTSKEFDTIDTLRADLNSGKNLPPSHPIFQLLQTFPTNLNEWLHRITNSEHIRAEFDETYTPLREIIQRIKLLNSNMEVWLALREEVSQMVVNTCPTDISHLIRYTYIICIFVAAYMETGNLDRVINTLRTMQTNAMDWMMTHTVVGDGPHKVMAFVSVSTMTDVFIPPAETKTYKTPVEREWEARLYATLFAKKYKWIPKKENESFIRLADSMEAYRFILQNREFSQLMEDTLLIGTILLKMHSRIRNVFTFEKMDTIEFKKEDLKKEIEKIKDDTRLLEAHRKQYIGELRELMQPKKNNARDYHFNSWESMFRPTKDYTLSMIQPEETFRGLAERIRQYITETTSFSFEAELTGMAQGRTRPLWDPSPTLGMIRPKGIVGPNGPIGPAVIKPVAVKPDAAMPNAVKPVAVKPVAVKPVAVRPFANVNSSSNTTKHDSKRQKILKQEEMNVAHTMAKMEDIILSAANKETMLAARTMIGLAAVGHNNRNSNSNSNIQMSHGGRRFSKTYCKKRLCRKMGFTERASCRPYKNCYRLLGTSLKKRPKRGTDTA